MESPHANGRRIVASCVALFVISQILGLVCWSLVPRIAPFLLDDAGFSATAMGWILGTLPQAFTLLLTPVVSILSDRTKTRFGRRTPYIWASALPLCLALVAIGEFHSTKLLLASALILFAIASVIPMTLFYLIIPDAIPPQYIGRFTAWNGMGASLTAAAYNAWGLAWSNDHIQMSMLLSAALYLLAVATLFAVRELPTEDKTSPQSAPSLPQTLTCCLKNKTYLGIFFSMGINQASMILRTIFGALFVTKTLGLSVSQYGHISGASALVGAFMALAVGHWVDKSRPTKVYLIGSVAVIAISLAGFFFARGFHSYAVIALLTALLYSIQSIAYIPLLTEVFPRENFGLLYSANATVCSLMVMAGSSLGARLTECLGYRFLFLWDSALTTLATACLLLAIRKITPMRQQNS